MGNAEIKCYNSRRAVSNSRRSRPPYFYFQFTKKPEEI